MCSLLSVGTLGASESATATFNFRCFVHRSSPTHNRSFTCTDPLVLVSPGGMKYEYLQELGRRKSGMGERGVNALKNVFLDALKAGNIKNGMKTTNYDTLEYILTNEFVSCYK